MELLKMFIYFWADFEPPLGFGTALTTTHLPASAMLSTICFALACVISALPFTHATTPTPLLVNLTTGAFQGFRTENGTEDWLGISFAQPPVGRLRFKAPVPVTQRAQGIQNATNFKDACPQRPGNLGAPMGEDCLGLNVRLS